MIKAGFKPAFFMPMIVLLSDFGASDPYQAQMQAVLQQQAPAVPVINLHSNLPSWEIQLAAYLIPAYVNEFPEGTVFLCVVDPGVGTDTRLPVVIQADGFWFVGPDNGLFDVIKSRASAVSQWQVSLPASGSLNSFHGRDLFAPVAATIARHEAVPGSEMAASLVNRSWPEELEKIIYCDHYGNAISGVRGSTVAYDSVVRINGLDIPYARVFGDAAPGSPFWYVNSNGLLECAVNQGSFKDLLNVSVGDRFEIIPSV